MITIEFTEKDVIELRDLLRNHNHEHIRRKALALLLKSQEIAHNVIENIIGTCGNTLLRYFEEYKSGGIEAISKLNFAKPESALAQHKQKIIDYINQKPPQTIKEACAEIKKITGVELKITQMRNYLKSIGVRCRRSCGIPAKADVAVQKAFLKNELQPRLDQALEGKRVVKFVDAAHFVLGGFLGFLWSFKRIFVKTPSGRQRYNVLGALDAVNKNLTTITNDTYITSVQVCELLEKIAQEEAAVPITCVMDNARYQHCALVIEKAKTLNIELLFLPSYSPNLNLIERVWKFVRKNCLNSKYYDTFSSFRGAIDGLLADMHVTHKSDLQSLLTLKFQMFSEEPLLTALT